MADEEITVRIHNRRAPPGPAERRWVGFVSRDASIILERAAGTSEGEGDFEEDVGFPVHLLIEHLLSRSFEEDGQLSKNEKVKIVFESVFCEEEFDCAVCSERCEKETEVARLICGHCFHENCIAEWGKYKQTCPVCRGEIQHKIRNF